VQVTEAAIIGLVDEIVVIVFQGIGERYHALVFDIHTGGSRRDPAFSG
jgi:hypothetical protein